MSRKLTPGKLAGLASVSDRRGVIAAAALDQRALLKKMLAREMDGDQPSDSMVSQFKELVTDELTRHASAILLDVEYGLPALKNRNGRGVLLAYEKSGYDATAPEFLPSVTEGWSVLRLREAGATAIKILLFYNPAEKSWVNEQKQAWVERIGAECRAHDIPLFLELLAYDVHGEDEKSLAYAKRKPRIVIESIQEFAKDRYAADVLKLEFPVQMQFVPEMQPFQGEAAYSRNEAAEYFREAAAAVSMPFVYLSAGVSNSAFIEGLEFALQSGVRFHGVLCGRATWQEGVPIFVKRGASALQDWLRSSGAANLAKVNRVLESATPWQEAASATASSLV
jgi:tagatose 1,6-diphosphate aldolase